MACSLMDIRRLRNSRSGTTRDKENKHPLSGVQVGDLPDGMAGMATEAYLTKIVPQRLASWQMEWSYKSAHMTRPSPKLDAVTLRRLLTIGTYLYRLTGLRYSIDAIIEHGLITAGGSARLTSGTTLHFIMILTF